MDHPITSHLPTEVLTILGAYVATCAHIELVMWDIVLWRHDQTPGGKYQDEQSRASLKKRTVLLLKEFGDCTAVIPASLSLEHRALHSEIREGLQNRDMAVHGAWHMTPDGRLYVMHHEKPGHQIQSLVPATQLRLVETDFNRERIDFALADAGSIYLRLLGLLARLRLSQ